jgi:predicted secreted protein
MATVRGKNVTVRIYDDGWKLYACASSCSLDVNTSVIETSVTGSGTWATFIPQKNSWSGSLQGVVNLDSDSSLTLYDLRVKQIALTEFQIQFERIDDDGNYYLDQGHAIIVNSSDTGSVDDINTFTIGLQGTGALTPILG